MFAFVAAIELRKRGWDVLVVEQHRVPSPYAASTDVSKAVRMDYGSDDAYCDAMLQCIGRWTEYNARWGQKLYHPTGVTYLAQTTMQPGGFEYESYQRLLAHKVEVERLDSRAIYQRFSAWREGLHVDGYFNPLGGWVQSGEVLRALALEARTLGVTVHEEEKIVSVNEKNDGVTVTLRSGGHFEVDVLLRCTGSWSAHNYPELREIVRCSGHPVFHLRPNDGDEGLFDWQRFPSFGADISKTGWYGFPLHPEEQVVKIAQHRVGRDVHPEGADCVVSDSELEAMWSFVKQALPALADAELTHTRLCCYADTTDGNFLIDRNPNGPSRVVYATGDSGHGFKFAPILGEWIADVVTQERVPLGGKFSWKNREVIAHGDEARSR